jgi:hypothetical protein
MVCSDSENESAAAKLIRRGLPQKSDLSFTPGFSPGITGLKDRGTVSTVFFFRKSPKRLKWSELRR